MSAVKVTLPVILFHEFQPIGGVSAGFAEGEAFSCATGLVPTSSMPKKTNVEEGKRRVFMQTFYQKRLQIGIDK